MKLLYTAAYGTQSKPTTGSRRNYTTPTYIYRMHDTCMKDVAYTARRADIKSRVFYV
jgi:hypothetical protein